MFVVAFEKLESEAFIFKVSKVPRIRGILKACLEFCFRLRAVNLCYLTTRFSYTSQSGLISIFVVGRHVCGVCLYEKGLASTSFFFVSNEKKKNYFLLF